MSDEVRVCFHPSHKRHPLPHTPDAADTIRRLSADNAVLREEIRQLRAAVNIYREVVTRVSREDRVA